MADIHIDDFYRDVASVLVLVYNAFPRKTLLLVEDIVGPDEPDEFGLHSPRHQACFSTIIWLADAGYLRYDTTVRQEAVDQAVLTHKGFTLLASRTPFAGQDDGEGLPPSVAEEHLSNIHQLRQALSRGSSGDLRKVVHQLLLQSRHHV